MWTNRSLLLLDTSDGKRTESILKLIKIARGEKCIFSSLSHSNPEQTNAPRMNSASLSFRCQSRNWNKHIPMAFACARPKTKDDSHRNRELEKRIAQSSVENMDLSNMNLTDEDILIVVQKAIRKKKCTSLSLASNKITADGVRMLFDTLKSNQRLTHLILSGNPIGDEGVRYITQLIASSRTIYHLALSDTGITDQGLQGLATTLQANVTFLRCLDLRSNALITDLSVNPLLQMVEHNETLSACRLDNCGLSQEGKDKLREAKSIRW